MALHLTPALLALTATFDFPVMAAQGDQPILPPVAPGLLDEAARGTDVLVAARAPVADIEAARVCYHTICSVSRLHVGRQGGAAGARGAAEPGLLIGIAGLHELVQAMRNEMRNGFAALHNDIVDVRDRLRPLEVLPAQVQAMRAVHANALRSERRVPLLPVGNEAGDMFPPGMPAARRAIARWEDVRALSMAQLRTWTAFYGQPLPPRATKRTLRMVLWHAVGATRRPYIHDE